MITLVLTKVQKDALLAGLSALKNTSFLQDWNPDENVDEVIEYFYDQIKKEDDFVFNPTSVLHNDIVKGAVSLSVYPHTHTDSLDELTELEDTLEQHGIRARFKVYSNE